MKRGLVMEGGAMRGMFTAGVIDVLMENNLYPDGAVGVSAGAAFGCNIKSHQIGRVIRYNVRFARNWRYCSWRSFFLTGDLYGAKFCYDTLPKKLDIWDTRTFASDPMAFYITATDIKTGKPLYHLCTDGGEDDLLWMRGSASMPIVSRPVDVDGYRLLDGGISDSIPLKFLEGKGYDRCVVILTQPESYRKKEYSRAQLDGLHFLLRKMPAIYDQLARRADFYNQEVAEVRRQEEAGNVVVVRPKRDLNISSTCHDGEEKIRVYDEGRAAGEAALERIRSFWNMTV